MGPDATDLRRELKWLAATLGAVRDFDVQIQSLGHACHALQAEPEAAGPVVCLFKARRTTARAALVGALAAPRFAELVGALETLLEQPWPAPESQPDAPWLIGARYRRLRRAGEAVLEDAPPEALPEGRIRAKQLRYTFECFADVYGQPARKLIRKTVRLQDVLGTVQPLDGRVHTSEAQCRPRPRAQGWNNERVGLVLICESSPGSRVLISWWSSPFTHSILADFHREDIMMSGISEKAILAGGCFWGMQDLFRRRPGVISTRVGYTGGTVANATYRNHGNHAEAIEIIFDPQQVSYRALLEWFFQIHDPTTKNRQGNDVGASYRSAIFYTSEEQKRIAEDTIADVNASGLWPGKVLTEVAPAGAFWDAEPEHQDYLERYPNGYTCHFPRPNWKLTHRAVAP